MSIQNLHTPWMQSDSELKSTFVAREGLLDAILSHLNGEWQHDGGKHLLLTGPRGIGKSHLLALVELQLREHPESFGNWLRVRFPPGAHGILTLRHWLIQWVSSAAAALQSEGVAPESFQQALAQSETLNDSEAIASLRMAIKEWVKQNKRKNLLFLESLKGLFGDRILKRPGEAKLLEEILTEDRSCLLLGTTQNIFHKLAQGEHALLPLFKVFRLEAFTAGEVRSLLQRRAQWEGLQVDRNWAARNAQKLSALYELTGGNPRITEMFYPLLQAGDALEEVAEGYLRLLERLTPHYRQNLQSLPEQQEQVLVTLAKRGLPATSVELARAGRTKTNQVTASLKRLAEAGFVKPLASQGQNQGQSFRLSEQIFHNWLSGPEAASPETNRLMVEFLNGWYGPEKCAQLLARYDNRIKERRDMGATPPEGELRLLEYLKVACLDVDTLPWKEEGRTESETSSLKDWYQLVVKGRAEEVEDKFFRQIEEAKNPAGIWLIWALGFHQCYMATGKKADFDAATKRYAKAVAVNPGKQKAWYYWGNLLAARWRKTRDPEQFDEAAERYARAVEVSPDKYEAWHAWANLLSEHWEQTDREADFEGAERHYARAIEVHPRMHRAWLYWGNLLAAKWRKTGEGAHFDKAAERYIKALEVMTDKHQALNNLASLYARRYEWRGEEEDFQKASGHYEAAVEEDPDKHQSWYNWGNLYSARWRKIGEESDFRRAAKRYARAVEVKPDKQEAWYNWGNLLSAYWRTTGNEEDFEAASDHYSSTVVIAPNMQEAWYNWGLLFAERWEKKEEEQDFEAASKRFAKATTLAPDMYLAWYRWGTLFAAHWRKSEAESDFEAAVARFEKAVEVRPEMPLAWYNYGNIYSDRWQWDGREEDSHKAASYYEQALALHPEMHQAWYNQGRMQYLRQDRLPTIEGQERALHSLKSFLSACPGQQEARPHRAQALAMLVSLNNSVSARQELLQQWVNTVAACASEYRPTVVLEGVKIFSRTIELAQLGMVLNRVRSAIPDESGYLVPYLDAVDALTKRRPRALENYPPAALQTLAEAIPAAGKLKEG